ncbi:MAG: hypothetical protein DRI44_05435 [Chlamydiae bacterium]|nr:MAG: hypothetical protein DRI44_05435 [Chlamydiota bacterium]
MATYQELIGEIREIAKNKHGFSKQYRQLIMAKRIIEITEKYKEIIDVRNVLIQELQQNKYYQLLKERRECQRIAKRTTTSDRVYTLALQRIKQINKIIKEMKQNVEIQTIYRYNTRINRINRINREIKKLMDELNSNYLFGIRNVIMKKRKRTEHIEAKEYNMSVTEYREFEKMRKIKIEWMKEKIAKLQKQKIFYIYKFIYAKHQKEKQKKATTIATKKQNINIAKIEQLAKMYI